MGDQYELRKGHICVWIVVCVLTIVFAPMLAESFERVMFDEYGIGYSTISGEIDTEVRPAEPCDCFVGAATTCTANQATPCRRSLAPVATSSVSRGTFTACPGKSLPSTSLPLVAPHQ